MILYGKIREDRKREIIIISEIREKRAYNQIKSFKHLIRYNYLQIII